MKPCRILFLMLGVVVATSGCAPNALYKYDAGPYPVRKIESLVAHDPVQDRDITMRFLYPEADGPFPLVVLSTGAFCFPQMYDIIVDHWVSHGYVVVEPNHLDSPNRPEKLRPDQYADLFPSRVRDVSFIVDEITEISARAGVPELVDVRKVAAAGHSFGAVIAMIKIGLALKPEHGASWSSTYDDRFLAAVLLSAPGPGIAEVQEGGHSAIRKPLIATGGTNDIGRVDPGELSAAEWRTMVYNLAPPGDKYSVITQGADHYMGGLICNPDLGGDADPESAAVVASMTTAFLDAYIKDSRRAKAFLKTADIDALTAGKARALRK